MIDYKFKSPIELLNYLYKTCNGDGRLIQIRLINYMSSVFINKLFFSDFILFLLKGGVKRASKYGWEYLTKDLDLDIDLNLFNIDDKNEEFDFENFVISLINKVIETINENSDIKFLIHNIVGRNDKTTSSRPVVTLKIQAVWNKMKVYFDLDLAKKYTNTKTIYEPTNLYLLDTIDFPTYEVEVLLAEKIYAMFTWINTEEPRIKVFRDFYLLWNDVDTNITNKLFEAIDIVFKERMQDDNNEFIYKKLSTINYVIKVIESRKEYYDELTRSTFFDLNEIIESFNDFLKKYKAKTISLSKGRPW